MFRGKLAGFVSGFGLSFASEAEIPDVEPEAKISSEDFEPEDFEEPEIDEVTNGDLERPTASFMDTLLILAHIFEN